MWQRDFADGIRVVLKVGEIIWVGPIEYCESFKELSLAGIRKVRKEEMSEEVQRGATYHGWL